MAKYCNIDFFKVLHKKHQVDYYITKKLKIVKVFILEDDKRGFLKMAPKYF